MITEISCIITSDTHPPPHPFAYWLVLLIIDGFIDDEVVDEICDLIS